jgi:hypothetical protein
MSARIFYGPDQGPGVEGTVPVLYEKKKSWNDQEVENLPDVEGLHKEKISLPEGDVLRVHEYQLSPLLPIKETNIKHCHREKNPPHAPSWGV